MVIAIAHLRVRVDRVGGEATSFLDILVSVLSPSTTAAVGGRVALGDLGRREDVVRAKGAHGVRLDLFGRREGPARAAVTLILHRGRVDTGPVLDGTDSCRKLWVVRDLGVASLLRDVSEQVALLELLLCKVRELGDAVDGLTADGELGGVAVVDDLQVLDEDAKAVLLHRLVVTLAVLSLERLPHVLLSGGGRGRLRGAQSRTQVSRIFP